MISMQLNPNIMPGPSGHIETEWKNDTRECARRFRPPGCIIEQLSRNTINRSESRLILYKALEEDLCFCSHISFADCVDSSRSPYQNNIEVII